MQGLNKPQIHGMTIVIDRQKDEHAFIEACRIIGKDPDYISGSIAISAKIMYNELTIGGRNDEI